jgi:foldase protein PrsA
MDYFLKRLKAAGSEPMSMLSTLAREEIVKQEADKYEIEITDEKIEHELRIIAAGSANATISDSEFKEWYRQRLNETGFSDSEYKEIIRTNVAANLIHQALAAAMPTTAEQIHLHVMLLESETLAYDVKGKLDAGEDFATLAREFSMDLNTRDDGGDIGWIPEGVADEQVEFFAWKLEAGGISEPFMVYDTSDPNEAKPVGYYIVWVSERAESREIDEKYISTLQNNLLVDWFNEQVQIYDVKYHGLSGNGFDSETYTWINWQVTK